MPWKAPKAPFGWAIWRYYYDGRPRTCYYSDERGRSWASCRAIAEAARLSDQFSELAIEPVGGWQTLRDDPLASILLAYRSGDISMSVAALRIHELYHAPPEDGAKEDQDV
jgi:hypothetical protein